MRPIASPRAPCPRVPPWVPPVLLPTTDAVTLFFCSPVIAAVLELVVTRKWSGWASVAASLCTVAGVVLVAQSSVGSRHMTHSVEHVVPAGGTAGSSVADEAGGGDGGTMAGDAAAAAAAESLSVMGVVLATAAATCSAVSANRLGAHTVRYAKGVG